MEIFEAVNAGNSELILQHISQINCLNEIGNTPLIVAIEKRFSEQIGVLIKSGADVNFKNKEGETALHFATKEAALHFVELLLDYGADVDARGAQEGHTALFIAARAGVLPIAELLLRRGANIDLPTTQAKSVPLIVAACHGKDAMVSMLLQHGANVHCGTVLDVTALIWAVEKCSHDTVTALLDAGANPWHTTKSGSGGHTPLSLARDELMKRIIRVYQQAGGSSWLERELSARGFEWSLVSDAQDRLAQEGITSRAALVSMPLARFTDAYLEQIGIQSSYLRQVLLDLRLQSTWLGARLTTLGVGPQGLRACETLVVHDWACGNESLFAQVPREELSDAYLTGLGLRSGVVNNCLRQVHEQVRAQQTTADTLLQHAQRAEDQAIRRKLSCLLAVTGAHNYCLPLAATIDDIRQFVDRKDPQKQREQLHKILLEPDCGLAVVAFLAKTRSRTNELFEQYVSFVQELLTVPGVLTSLTSIAEEESKVLFVRGFLRLKPGYQLTDNEDRAVRNTVVHVENAGVPEVNGKYHFTDVRFNAGFYTRRGLYNNKEVHFTLYKCSLKNGGFQWFLSITPDGMEPGTSSDLDFYFALAKAQDKLPAIYWLRMNPDPKRLSRGPAPLVTCLRPDLGDSSNSDQESSYEMMEDDSKDA